MPAPTIEKYLKKHPAKAEYRFLFDCCRAAFAGTINTRISYPKNINSETFLHLLKRHKLITHLYPLLKNQCEGIPDDILDNLFKILSNHNYHILKLSRELIKLSDLFAKHDITWLSIKGPVLSMKLYGDLALRQSGDLDILVSYENLNRTIDVLISAGYIPSINYSRLSSVQLDLIRKSYKDEVFLNKTDDIHIELHWMLNLDPNSPLNQNIFNKNIDSFSIGTRMIKTLPYISDILYTCTHGFHHGWYRLFWLWDFATIIKNLTQEQEMMLIEAAKKYNCEKALGQSIALSTDIFSINAPEQLKRLTKLTSSQRVVELAYWYIITSNPMSLSNFFKRLIYTTRTYPISFFIPYYCLRFITFILRKYKKAG